MWFETVEVDICSAYEYMLGNVEYGHLHVQKYGMRRWLVYEQDPSTAAVSKSWKMENRW